MPSAFIAPYSGSPALWKWTGPSGPWGKVVPDPPNLIWSMDGTAENDLWLACTTGTGLIRLLHWNGSAYTLQTLPGNASSSSTRGLVRVWDQNTVWFLGHGNGPRGLWKTTTGGPSATWTLISSAVELLNMDDMALVGPDECYLSGSSGGLSAGLSGLIRATSGGISIELEANGLPRQWPSPTYNIQYRSVAVDRSTGELWVMDGGQYGAPSHLYRGYFGGPWTLAITLDSTDGYAFRLNTSGGSMGGEMEMDADGILYYICTEAGGDPDAVYAGNPRLAQPSLTSVASGSSSNHGVGDRVAKGGYVLMADNGRGLFYIPGTGWTVPTIDAGNYGGHALTQDLEGPYLDNLSPYDAEVGVDPNSNIVLEIKDNDTGVNAASVVIEVNGDTVWTGDAAANPSVYAVAKTVLGNGFRYTINPAGMLPPGTTTVVVYAEDLA